MGRAAPHRDGYHSLTEVANELRMSRANVYNDFTAERVVLVRVETFLYMVDSEFIRYRKYRALSRKHKRSPSKKL